MNYYEIGHERGSAMVWIFKKDLDWRRNTQGTHETLYGEDHVNHWRGRLELKSKRCSIRAPKGSQVTKAPDWLLAALKANFGDDLKIVNFGLSEWSDGEA